MGVVFSLPLEKDQDEEGPQFNGGKERQAAHFEEYLDVVTRCCCLVLLDLRKQTPRLA